MYNIFRTATGRFMYAENNGEFELLSTPIETASTIDLAQSRCDELNSPNREIPIDVRNAHASYCAAVDADMTDIIWDKLQIFNGLCDKYKLPYNCMDKKQTK